MPLVSFCVFSYTSFSVSFILLTIDLSLSLSAPCVQKTLALRAAVRGSWPFIGRRIARFMQKLVVSVYLLCCVVLCCFVLCPVQERHLESLCGQLHSLHCGYTSLEHNRKIHHYVEELDLRHHPHVQRGLLELNLHGTGTSTNEGTSPPQRAAASAPPSHHHRSPHAASPTPLC